MLLERVVRCLVEFDHSLITTGGSGEQLNQMAQRTVLPDSKFDGSERVPVGQYLAKFDLYVELNEWNDAKATKYLVVHLTEDAKVFLHELIQRDATVTNSYKSLKQRLLSRYEGGLATLRYTREWQQRVKRGDESLHQFLTDLCLKYERAFPPPPVLPPRPEAINELSEEDNQRLTALLAHEKQAGRLEEYQERREMSLKTQLINGLPLKLRGVLVTDDGLLGKPLEQIVKRVASIEAEKGGRVQLTAAMTGMAEMTQVDAVTTKNKKWRRAKPKSDDICRKCGRIKRVTGQEFVHQKVGEQGKRRVPLIPLLSTPLAYMHAGYKCRSMLSPARPD